jgi:hypothetical protein
MKTFDLTFEMDNDAFSDEGEVRRILERVSAAYEEGLSGGIIRDANGNNVGSWVIANA